MADQAIVITGATSGIGLVTARMAAKRGARVMLVARNEEALAAIVEALQLDGHDAYYAVADVADAGAVEEAAAKAVAAFGRLDAWVNNAGVAIYAPLLETPLKEHERLFQTNYFGVVNGARAAVPHLREHGGALITVGSIAAEMPSPVLGAYTASKHAVKGYIDSLRIELEAEGLPISVTLIKPSGMATPIARHAANHLDGLAKVPPPAYDPELVAKAILYTLEHPRREMTVGGIGRAEALFATHFPDLFARLAPVVTPSLRFPGRPQGDGEALWRPAAPGQERSPDERGRRFSLYSWAVTHRGAVAGGLAVAGLASAAAIARKRLSKPG